MAIHARHSLESVTSLGQRKSHESLESSRSFALVEKSSQELLAKLEGLIGADDIVRSVLFLLYPSIVS